MQDVNSSNIAFAQGLTDIESIAPDNVAWVKRGEAAYDYKILDMGPSSSTNFIWFNQKEVKNTAGEAAIPEHRLAWFRDARFRRAISYGIDREGIIQGVYFNRALRLDGYVSSKRKFWYNQPFAPIPIGHIKHGNYYWIWVLKIAMGACTMLLGTCCSLV